MSYDMLDTPRILQYIYYPRRDSTPPPRGCEAIQITVDEERGISIGCRFYQGEKDWPLLVYFHGNGEVAADYDDIASFYRARRINLWVADFRGYGSSTGQPTIASQLEDAPLVFSQAVAAMRDRGFAGRAFVMGRSMGSLSGLAIVDKLAGSDEEPSGLILESGFCCITRLIKLFGIPADPQALARIEASALEKVQRISIPVLIIHGAYDSLVPPEEGELIYKQILGDNKEMVIIARAGHNDIMFMDIPRYYGSIEGFVQGGGERQSC